MSRQKFVGRFNGESCYMFPANINPRMNKTGKKRRMEGKDDRSKRLLVPSAVLDYMGWAKGEVQFIPNDAKGTITLRHPKYGPRQSVISNRKTHETFLKTLEWIEDMERKKSSQKSYEGTVGRHSIGYAKYSDSDFMRLFEHIQKNGLDVFPPMYEKKLRHLYKSQKRCNFRSLKVWMEHQIRIYDINFQQVCWIQSYPKASRTLKKEVELLKEHKFLKYLTKEVRELIIKDPDPVGAIRKLDELKDSHKKAWKQEIDHVKGTEKPTRGWSKQ